MENKEPKLTEFTIKMLQTALRRPVKIDVSEGRRGFVVSVVDSGLGVKLGEGRAKSFEAALRAAEADAAESVA
jgi:hypothetical protein